jgi:hypothetical protein
MTTKGESTAKESIEDRTSYGKKDPDGYRPHTPLLRGLDLLLSNTALAATPSFTGSISFLATAVLLTLPQLKMQPNFHHCRQCPEPFTARKTLMGSDLHLSLGRLHPNCG